MSNFTSFVGDIATNVVNVIRMQFPVLRINLQLGDIDIVFDPIGTVLGKKQRLQALGYYYEVITGPAAGNTVTEAYSNCLAAWRRRRETVLGHPFASDNDLELDLQNQIRSRVVESGILPVKGTEVRIIFPGAFTFNQVDQLAGVGVLDGSPLPSHRFGDEGTMWTNNPALGKIPLVAHVEEQRTDGSWIASSNRWIHFQLIPPYHDDAGHELDDINLLRNQSEQGAAGASAVVPNVGPRPFITNAIGAGGSFDPNDPQRYNAHENRGGKRGLPLLNNLFESLPAAPFPGMNTPQASTHNHAVQVQTNANGNAGVLFLPNRFGGDRYRIRIFIDPIGLRSSDGTGKLAVVHETGRFCVWKHILWSRFIWKPLPTLPPIATTEGVQARLSILGYDTGPLDGIAGPRTIAAIRAFQQNNHPPLVVDGIVGPNTGPVLDQAVTDYIASTGQTLGVMDFAAVRSQFQQMYCILDDVDVRTTSAIPLSSSLYLAALKWAISQAHTNQGAYGLSQVYNIHSMFDELFDTPHLFTIRHPLHYRRTRGPGVPAPFAGVPPNSNYLVYWQDARLIIYSVGGLLDLFLRFITGNASDTIAPSPNLNRYSTPGLTLIQSLSASQLMFAANHNGQVQIPRLGAWSGIARQERGCFIFYGANIYVNWPYQGDGFTKNSMHEMGHTLYLRHHRTQVGGLHVSSSFREDHDDTDRCLMGYLFCEGEYCGKCHLKIRGWNISQMPV